jgi:hypothetical protein
LKVKESEAELTFSKIKAVQEKLIKASSILGEHRNKLKQEKVVETILQQQSGYQRSFTRGFYGMRCYIERAFSFLKGKHNMTKAKLLVKTIMKGDLFKGEAASAVSEVTRQHGCSLFYPWKLVKAGDISSVGSFKTSTINALRNIVDENDIGYFPSATTVNPARALLDNYGMEVVGYHQKDTKYGEVYYLNFKKAFCLLLKACKLDKLAETTSVKVVLTVD